MYVCPDIMSPTCSESQEQSEGYAVATKAGKLRTQL